MRLTWDAAWSLFVFPSSLNSNLFIFPGIKAKGQSDSIFSTSQEKIKENWLPPNYQARFAIAFSLVSLDL